MIKSPITGLDNITLEREIPSSFIIEQYKKELGVDVSKFFSGIERISIYKCLDTGYRFYYPFAVSGDDAFYQKLEKFPWYYMDWKWEHDIAENFIKKNDKVLEIGCAKGSFLKKIRESGGVVEGLEMNSDAMAKCVRDGLSVYPETIEKFSLNKKNTYDIVCSFQVLEHISDVKAFIESSLSVLKPRGLMIVSVPNNDCFMLKSNDQTLNMPPHHMGLWNMNSLIKLQNHFKMKIEAIHLEPLQSYHVGFTDKMVEQKLNDKLREKLGLFGALIKNMAKRFANLGVSAVSEYIIGHTILVVFRKNYE